MAAALQPHHDRRRRRALALAAGGTVGALAWAYHYFRHAARAPRVQVGRAVQSLLTECPALTSTFYPTPWATGRHLQTLLSVLRIAPRMDLDRQILHCADGGHVALDWWPQRPGPQDPLSPEAPTLLICHGITGGSHESYVRHLAAAARSRGWRSCVLNYRGCGGLALTSPAVYSAAMTEDVRLAVGELGAALPLSPLVACGVSLGAMILTKYLREHVAPGAGGPVGLVGAASLSNPFCMHEGQKSIERPGMTWLYNFVIAFRLRQYAWQHRGSLENVVDYGKLKKSWSIRDFERHVILPVFGYRDLDHYYLDGSSQHHIPHIRLPTMFLVAEDDPFLGRIPWEEAAENPHVLVAATARGGHVGFLQGLWPFGRSWMDRATMEYLAACVARSGAARKAAAAAAEEAGGSEAAGASAGAGAGVGVGRGAGRPGRIGPPTPEPPPGWSKAEYRALAASIV